MLARAASEYQFGPCLQLEYGSRCLEELANTSCGPIQLDDWTPVQAKEIQEADTGRCPGPHQKAGEDDSTSEQVPS